MAHAAPDPIADGESTDPVDALLDEVFASPPAQWYTSLDALCELFPERARALRRRIQCLQSHGILAAPVVSRPGSASRFGDYELGPLLGYGAMGMVFDACHEPSGERVALKLLRPELLAEAAAVQRFRQEAELAAHLDHPHLCRVRAAGSIDGTPFLAMQRILGETLADRILRARQHGRAATPDIAATAQLAEKIARGLGHLHERGLVHRDIKPGNILITADNEPVLCDFGLAWSSTAASLTRTGAVLGTPAYMAPEQLRGAAEVTPRADVHALGATLFEALALRPPFDSVQREDLYRRILTEPAESVRRWNPEVSAALATVIGRCLEKDPRRRYAHGNELADDLERYRCGYPVLARPPGLLVRGARTARRRPVATSLGLAAVFALLFLLAMAQHLHRSASNQATLAALAAERLSGQRPTDALRSALALFEQEATPAARSALVAAMVRSHQVDEVRHTDVLGWSGASPDGRTLLIGTWRTQGTADFEGDAASMASSWSRVLVRHGMFGAWAADGRFALAEPLRAPRLFDPDGMPIELGAVDPPVQVSTERVYQPRPRLAFDAHGNLIVGDRLGRIHQFDPGGRHVSSWQPHVGETCAIYALWVLDDGQVLSVATKDDKDWALQGIALSSHENQAGTQLPINARGVIRDVARSAGGHVVGLALQQPNTRTTSVLGVDTRVSEPVFEVPLGAAEKVFAIALDEHGEHFLVAADRTILALDRNGTTKLLGTVGSQPTAMAYWSARDADHDLLAIAEFAGPIHVFSLSLGRELDVLQGHTEAPRHLQFRADGSELMSAAYDGTARRWRLRSTRMPVMEHRDPVFAGAWLPDSQHVVVRTGGALSLWHRSGLELASEPVAGGGLGRLALPRAGHPLSPTGGAIVSVGAEELGLQLWSCRPGADAPLVKNPVQPTQGMWPLGMAFTAEGWLVASGKQRTRVYDENFVLHELADVNNLQGSLRDTSLAPDGSLLATCGDGLVHVFRLVPQGRPDRFEPEATWSQPCAVKAVAFAPEDGTQRLLAGRTDGTVVLLDLASRSEHLICRHEGGFVTSVSWSPDGRRVLSTGSDGLARVFAASGELIVDLPHGGIVWDARFSPDGRHVLTCSSQGSARIWPIEDDELLLVARSLGMPSK